MSERRFFVDSLARDSNRVVLTGQEAHHALNVLRLRPGDCVELHEGHGAGGWKGVIDEVRPGTVLVRITGSTGNPAESPLNLTLAIAYARTDKMESVLRQATELGVDRILVFRADRSQYGLSDHQAARKRERWVKILREALCQSGRSKLPELLFIASTDDCMRLVSSWKAGGGDLLAIVGSERENERDLPSLSRAFPGSRRMIICIGPEGGWSEDEMHRFVQSGFFPVHLGPRILRYETAAVAFLTAAQLLWGDFGIPLKEARS